MSWDSYIDNLLGQCQGAVDQACILGKDGSKWTTDAHANGLKVDPSECAEIADAFNKKDFTKFQQSGVKVNGVKYNFLRDEEIGQGKVVYAKKKDHGAVTLQSTNQTILIGHVKEGQQQGVANKGVNNVAEYLQSLNY